MGHTYGTWLPWDGRGFRTRHHREHVDGDYRSPPPVGMYNGLRRHSKSSMKREPVHLDVAQLMKSFGLLRNGRSSCGSSASTAFTYTYWLGCRTEIRGTGWGWRRRNAVPTCGATALRHRAACGPCGASANRSRMPGTSQTLRRTSPTTYNRAQLYTSGHTIRCIHSTRDPCFYNPRESSGSLLPGTAIYSRAQ